MENQEIRILGLLITDRKKEAGKTQDTLTKYGCTIRTRLGITVNEQIESGGLILLELFGSNIEMDHLESELRDLEGIQVQKMIF